MERLRELVRDAFVESRQRHGSPRIDEDLVARGITCSMSRRGNCFDNAVMDSFFSTVKSEPGEHVEAYGIAKEELFDYIEVRAVTSGVGTRDGGRLDRPPSSDEPRSVKRRSQPVHRRIKPLPAIVSDEGSLKHDVEEGSMVVIRRPCDPDDQARAIERHFTGDLYASLESRRRTIHRLMSKRHSWDAVGAITKRAYEPLVG